MAKFHITEVKGDFRLHVKEGDNGAGLLIENPLMREALRELFETLKYYADAATYDEGLSDYPDGPYCPEYPILRDRGKRAQGLLGHDND